MGCCYSGEEDKGYSEQGPNERSRLLTNPVGENATSGPHNSYTVPSVPSQQSGDEQSALNRILHQTASNVIDVSAMDSQSMEQHEYLDRAKQYQSRVVSFLNNSTVFQSTPKLIAGVAVPHVVLAGQPVSVADIQLINQASETTYKMFKEIKVRHKEDLVVPFAVP